MTRSQPTPDELAIAPELAVLAALDAVLSAARPALLVAHADHESSCLAYDDYPKPPPSVIAQVLIRQMEAMSLGIALYRELTRADLGLPPSSLTRAS
jgi:hypothetical protein